MIHLDDLPPLRTTPIVEPLTLSAPHEFPFTVHFFTSKTVLLTEMRGRTFEFGDELQITAAIYELSKDRNGQSWLDLIDDTDAQIERWGKVRYARGPWPEALPRVQAGSPEEADLIAREWAEAWKLPTEEERNEARAALYRKYGSPPQTSRHLGFLPGDAE